MCRIYERENCPHMDYLKETLPKFKKSRPKVTYEDPLTPMMEALPVQISPNTGTLPQNDVLVRDVRDQNLLPYQYKYKYQL